MNKFLLPILISTVLISGCKNPFEAKDKGIDLEFGCLGENILLDFDPHTLKVGTNLIIGDAIIQITQVCTVCNHLAVFDESLPLLLKGHRGLYCRIVDNGIVSKDMIVKIEG